MTWHRGPLVGLDLETTSADPETARIVQVGLVTLTSTNKVDRRGWLVNPGVPIPPEATAIHGITDAMVQADGLTTEESLEHLTMMLGHCHDDGVPVVIYNAPYDMTVCDRESGRVWGEGLDAELPPIVDPLCLINGTTLWKRSHTLGKACEVYRIPYGTAHDAAEDALAAARLTWRLAENLRVLIGPEDRGVDLGFHGRNVTVPQTEAMTPKVMDLKDVPLDVLQRAQVRWYLASARGFIENQQSKGRQPTGVNTQWPVIRRPLGVQ